MSFILNNCLGIGMIFGLIFFVSIVVEKRMSSLFISLITLSFGLFLTFYAANKMNGFEAIDVYVKGLIFVGEALILLVVTSIFIVLQER
ncbi:hypothetical protein [Priestia megaterium]|uniref:hypothetical protein n=1 Tax=Priestia megaterium TaxID=1404 RepID=UPI00272F23EA|nr:hypothetical protein [Priestia megaterium]MDP1442547.1 hypothetical protein [Priestia megaterium]MDP1471616.1 hypothetical protein [Priestia megaterium]MDR0132227.1 hypothetical protein [Priestia megaterium]